MIKSPLLCHWANAPRHRTWPVPSYAAYRLIRRSQSTAARSGVWLPWLRLGRLPRLRRPGRAALDEGPGSPVPVTGSHPREV